MNRGREKWGSWGGREGGKGWRKGMWGGGDRFIVNFCVSDSEG